jgi:hypothetical protein
MTRLLALWGAPRTISTAFERMMRERGDHEVVFEPFAAHYYFSADRRSSRFDGEVEPQPSHDFEAILDRLEVTSRRQPVFIKDMAYHVVHRADEELLATFQHTFIVRHPRFALVSLARIWPDFTDEEAGFAPLRRLFELVADRDGHPPPVIDGEDLLADPARVVAAWCDAVGLSYSPEALSWDAGRAEDWGRWSRWTSEVERSQGLPVEPTPPRDPDDVQVDDPRLEEAIERCLPHYEHLARHAL